MMNLHQNELVTCNCTSCCTKLNMSRVLHVVPEANLPHVLHVVPKINLSHLPAGGFGCQNKTFPEQENGRRYVHNLPQRAIYFTAFSVLLSIRRAGTFLRFSAKGQGGPKVSSSKKQIELCLVVGCSDNLCRGPPQWQTIQINIGKTYNTMINP